MVARRPLRRADDLSALDELPPVSQDGEVLVGGGWIGWLGYDGSISLGYYDHVLVHRAGRWTFEALWSDERAADLDAELAVARALMIDESGEPTYCVGEFTGADRDRHLSAVERAIGLIRAGEIYQVNVCTRLTAEFAGSAAALFADAAAALAPAWGAFVAGTDRSVASLSPESFLRVDGRTVTTAPIKGTSLRSSDDRDPDGPAARALRASAKEVAENVMIVDLMRNDLGRVCRAGSVRASALLDVEAHPGLWHLVSTVTGTLRDDVRSAELVRAAFPPGSVTGVPKVRAARAIADLEAGPRGVYTGAIGLASPVAGLRLSVAIRTFEIADGRIELGVGGGITAGSVPMREWAECLDKAAPLIAAVGAPRLSLSLSSSPLSSLSSPRPGRAGSDHRAGGVFDTLLAVDGVPMHLADHLGRLERSVEELYGRGLSDDIDARVRAAAAGGVGRRRVRVAVAPDGSVEISSAAAGNQPGGSALVTARRPGGLWRHKWADRSWIGRPDSLYVDDRGFVLETERGNVFAVTAQGQLVTAPLDDDVLPGVTRRYLLDRAADHEIGVEIRPLPLAELLSSAGAFWTSCLALVVPIDSIDGRPIEASEIISRLRYSVDGDR